MVRSITWALAIESQPSANASATGASVGRRVASASRTVAGPSPCVHRATAVTKSVVEAQPSASTPLVASRSRTTSSSRRRSATSTSDLSEGVQLTRVACRPQHIAKPADQFPAGPTPPAHPPPPTSRREGGAGHGSTQALTTDSPRAPESPVWKEDSKISLGVLRDGFGPAFRARGGMTQPTGLGGDNSRRRRAQVSLGAAKPRALRETRVPTERPCMSCRLRIPVKGVSEACGVQTNQRGERRINRAARLRSQVGSAVLVFRFGRRAVDYTRMNGTVAQHLKYLHVLGSEGTDAEYQSFGIIKVRWVRNGATPGCAQCVK